jgi:transcriptional antiterminator Rof (Rho-off)
MRLFGLVSAFVLALLGSALAQESAGISNGMPYVSGGIGLDSREALRAKEGEYNLKVILALKDGHYLGGGAVTVHSQSGKTVLEVDAKGPWMLAKLTPGTYTVEAKIGDATRSRQVVIGKKGLKRVVLTWDKEPA